MKEIDKNILDVSAIANITYYFSLKLMHSLNELGCGKTHPMRKQCEAIYKQSIKLKNNGESLLDHSNYSAQCFYPGADFTEPLIQNYIDDYTDKLNTLIQEGVITK